MVAFDSLDSKYVTWQILKYKGNCGVMSHWHFVLLFGRAFFLLSYGEWNMIAMMLDITPFQTFQPVSKSMLHRFMGERLVEWDIALMIMLGGECFAWIGFKPHSCYHTLQKNRKSIHNMYRNILATADNFPRAPRTSRYICHVCPWDTNNVHSTTEILYTEYR